MTALAESSMAEQLASLPEAQIRRLLRSLGDVTTEALEYEWRFWARPNQLQPDWAWHYWLVRAGRGFGKTRVGAETVIEWSEELGRGGRIALVGRTAADVRDTMIEGEAGIMACSPPWNKPLYEPSKRRVTWPNGCMAIAFTSEKPDMLRGPAHHKAWCDELAAWKYLMATWDMLSFGLRLGDKPQAIITTTPKPVKLLIDLAKRHEDDVHLTIGSTYDNRANLADAFVDAIIKRYENTRLGRQEIHAEQLEEAEGALWKRDLLEQYRLQEVPRLQRVVVALDPSATGNEDSDEAGIVVAGKGVDGRAYVLADLSEILTPLKWAQRTVGALYHYSADRIIGEANNGGDMIETTIRTVDKSVPYKKIWASRGKQARAEPVAALYEQGLVSHVGFFSALEDEYCNWEPDSGQPSPNRLDAAVWALTELMLAKGGISQSDVQET